MWFIINTFYIGYTLLPFIKYVNYLINCSLRENKAGVTNCLHDRTNFRGKYSLLLFNHYPSSLPRVLNDAYILYICMYIIFKLWQDCWLFFFPSKYTNKAFHLTWFICIASLFGAQSFSCSLYLMFCYIFYWIWEFKLWIQVDFDLQQRFVELNCKL